MPVRILGVNNLKQVKVSAWYPKSSHALASYHPLRVIEAQLCSMRKRQWTRKPPLLTAPRGCAKPPEWGKHLTDHQRRLVAFIRSFAPI